jgi:subtilase family serine protease
MGQNVLFTVTLWYRTYCVQLHYGTERIVCSYIMGQNVPCAVTFWDRTYCVQLHYGAEGTVYSYIMGYNTVCVQACRIESFYDLTKPTTSICALLSRLGPGGH